MALIHKNSCPCVGSQLDLFSVPGTQTSQEKNTYVPHYPITNIGDGPIEFEVKASSMYTDLSDTRLFLRCKVVKADNTALADTDNVTVANMLFHAMMQRIDVYVGNTLITQSGAFYAWKSGIETLLNFGSDAKGSHLANIMYYKDTGGNVNPGGEMRKELVQGSKTFEMYGPLHVDFFFQPKYLVSNVPMRIKITRNNPDFYMVNGTGIPCKLKIMECVLYIRRVQVAPSIELAHAKSMMSGKNAIYPIQRADIEVTSVPAMQQTVTRDNLFMTRLPKKLIIGMVKNSVFNGIQSEHPYNFEHFNIQSIEVSVDGENVCGTPLVMDFADQNYMRAYDGMFVAMNKAYSDAGTDLTYQDFKNGYTLFCFDLTADGCGNTGQHFELAKQGNLRVKIHFKQPLQETINIICYGEFESILEITQNREVLLDYRK